MRQSTDQTNNLKYTESISSNKTEALFLVLMMLSLLLLIWRVTSDGLDILAVAFICLFIIFLFYSLNYRTLLIHLTKDSLKLTFGIFTWTIPVDNIQEYSLDELPVIMKYGGAGIHFMFVRKRYRASFNFLEYPRIVIAFKRKVGLVRDISFSTRQPGDVIHLIQEIISANQAA
jgi:Ca2+/Na+ antiporter